ncbi:MAG: MBL fold metallo-hydrolase [Chloroflexota bacterium]
MNNYICKTCGTQFSETAVAPTACTICEDERQYIGWAGQQWTTLAELRTDHHNEIRELEPNLTGIGTHPTFAIGQRAILVQTPSGNVLWDCISLLDDATIAAVKALGGIDAIAISHPHFYSSMVEWSRAFHAPIYLHKADKEWVMRPDAAIVFWEGDRKLLWSGMTLIRGGGHFDGGTMLHWAAGAGGAGALLTGDIIQVVPDRRYVSFMYSYPNLIPLSSVKVQQVVDAVQPYDFARIYAAWWGRVMQQDAKIAVSRSATRYIQAL